MAPAAAAKLRILIVEDNPTDVMLVQMAMEEGGLSFDALVAEDGDAAIQYLCAGGSGTQYREPDVIILDLNLPKRHGTEVLRAIRGRENPISSTVVILSSSPEDVIEKVIQSAHVEADCYLTKPPSLDGFLALGRIIRECHESRRRPGSD